MDTNLTTISDTKLSQWQRHTGVKSFSQINHIKFDNSKIDKVSGKENKNYGKLFAVKGKGDDAVQTEIPLDTEFFFVKARVQIKCSKADAEGKPLYWCREIDRADSWLEIMQDKEKVAEGFYRDLKEQYHLKYSDAVYVYYEGEIYRWLITGAHFDSWFAVKNKCEKRPMKFKIAGLQEKTAGGGAVWFNSITFELAGEYPIDEALKIAESVDEGLAAYYKDIKEKEVPRKEPIDSVDYHEDLPWEADSELTGKF